MNGIKIFFKRLLKEKPLGFGCSILTFFFIFVGLFANFLAPYGMNETDLGNFLSQPDGNHWMGTDNLGRDILTRIIYGARISIIIGFGASFGATLLSLSLIHI